MVNKCSIKNFQFYSFKFITKHILSSHDNCLQTETTCF